MSVPICLRARCSPPPNLGMPAAQRQAGASRYQPCDTMSSLDEQGRGWDQWPNAHTREEYRRVRLIERAYDACSIAHLERLGVAPGWRCLEVGAGAGSIAIWLARRAGAENVVATELRTEFLAPVRGLGVRVVRHDIRVDPPPGDQFDLIHARAVLEHIPTRHEVIERLVSWLAPGGWLLLEEAATVPEMSRHELLRRSQAALVELLARTVGTDMTWALTFPLPFAHAGLVDVDAMLMVPVMRGGSAMAAIYHATVEALGPGMIAAGSLTADELTKLAGLYADPSVVDFSGVAIAGWGRRRR